MTCITKYLIPALMAFGAVSCIEDGFTTDPADAPAFSAETVEIGEVFTGDVTPTVRFLVYNHHSKGLNISNITLDGADAECFRLNVDGISGHSFSNVEIRAKDSIYVLVEARLPEVGSPEPREFTGQINFLTNGRTSTVGLTATGRDVRRLKALTITEDTHLTSEMPIVVFDSLVVSPGVTLTAEAGTSLLFHDKASLIVRGTLACQGTVAEPVTLAGDRIGKLVGDLDFEIMSRQWTGVFFTPTSAGNVLEHTVVKNTVQGVAVDGSSLRLRNCRLRNSAYTVLEAYHSDIDAIGCEFAEAAEGLVYLQGGTARFNHCTFANNYLYAVISGPALGLAHVSADETTGLDDGSGLPYLTAEVSNSIIYGYGPTLSHGDLAGTGVMLRNCLIKGEGEDDDNFLATIWDTDPLFFTVRSDYFFDYRLQKDSPAIGAADPALTLPEAATDFYGLPRGETPDLGAYVFDPTANQEEQP